MKAVAYDAKVCRNPDLALAREWEEKNDKGAYAASSILCANTKTSHGLLVAPEGRMAEPCVLLSGLEETLYIGERSYPLSTHVHARSVSPRGFEHLEHFYRLPFPTWIFRLEGLALVKMVIVIGGENTVLIRYQLLSSYGDYVRLELRPLVAFRGISETGKEGSRATPKMKVTSNVIRLEPPNDHCPSLYLSHNAAVVDRSGVWFKGFQYRDASSDKMDEENLYSPCSFLYAFLQEEGVFLSASTNPARQFDPFLIGVKEKGRRRKNAS